MNDLFGTAPINATAWLKIIGVAAVAWIIIELEKAIRRHRAGNQGRRARAGNSVRHAV